MTIGDWIFGSEDRGLDNSLDYLIANGFTPSEAPLIKKINFQMVEGGYIGLSIATFINYSLWKTKSFRVQLIPKRWLPVTYPLVFVAGFSLGNFFLRSNRTGANTPFANIYTNNILVHNKRQIVSNFYSFNRKFTQEEIEQMRFNLNLKKFGPKKYTYNPNIHGPDEAKHREKHERFNSGVLVVTQESLAKINKENQAKIAAGENVHIYPFNFMNHVTTDGTDVGLVKFGLLHKRETI
jgi:hypothetical protein